MHRFGAVLIAGIVLAGPSVLVPASAFAQSLDEALGLAYANNPQINAQRAANRAADENIPIQKSGLRPNVSLNASKQRSWTDTTLAGGIRNSTDLTTGRFGITLSQTLFDGWRTKNNVAAARAAIKAQRENLRNTEQNVLFDGVSAYMDVIRDSTIVEYRTKALEFLNEQVRAEQARFEVGETTKTTVSQAVSRRAGATASRLAAIANLSASKATYAKVIGTEPGKLRTPKLRKNMLPASTQKALSLAAAEHPSILATQHLAEQAEHNVEANKGALLPTLSLEGSANRTFDPSTSVDRSDNRTIVGRLNVPLYQGGRVHAQVRQSKEVLGQRRIEIDNAVNNVRAAVISAYSQLSSADAQINSINAQIKAAREALDGVVEERKVGQRTTLDVLAAQQEVINAQISLAGARRNAIVARYAVLSAIGRLDHRTLGLKVTAYDAEEHLHEIKDKWFGLRSTTGAQ